MRRVKSFKESNNPFPRSFVKHEVYHADKNRVLRDASIKYPLYFGDQPLAFGKYVTKAFVNIRNPFYPTQRAIEMIAEDMPARDLQQWMDSLVTNIDKDDPLYDLYLTDPINFIVELSYDHVGIIQHELFYKQLKRDNFDGIISEDEFGSHNEYLVFDSKQIYVIETFVK